MGGNMTEKMTMKSLSVDLQSMAGEIESLRKKLSQMERQMNRKIDTAIDKAVADYANKLEVRRNEESHGAGVDTAERQRLIAEAAYLMAEQRGFIHGDPSQDWLNAEEEVNRMLLQGDSG